MTRNGCSKCDYTGFAYAKIPCECQSTTPALLTKKAPGTFLGNVHDPNAPNAQMYFTYSFHAWDCGPDAMRWEWEQHLRYLNENNIGPPKATEKYTVRQLEEMGLVGVYAK